MTEAVRRRGPDDVGYYLQGGVALGHRRLSIIDLSDRRRTSRWSSMTSSSALMARSTIIGEVPLRPRAVRPPVSPRLADTEVILHAFRQWGPRCVDRFIGIFAMAIYDRRERALICSAIVPE